MERNGDPLAFFCRCFLWEISGPFLKTSSKGFVSDNVIQLPKQDSMALEGSVPQNSILEFVELRGFLFSFEDFWRSVSKKLKRFNFSHRYISKNIV